MRAKCDGVCEGLGLPPGANAPREWARPVCGGGGAEEGGQELGGQDHITQLQSGLWAGGSALGTRDTNLGTVPGDRSCYILRTLGHLLYSIYHIAL